MAAEQNVIVKSDMAKAREIDYVWRFVDDIRGLMELLGIIRPIPVVAGTLLKAYKATGELIDGSQIAEGDIIPLSNFKTVLAFSKEASINKYRKATTAEAILKGGFDQAVAQTNQKALSEAHKGIKNSLLAAFTPETGTTPATGNGLQQTLANASAKLAIKFEDTDYEPVHIVNPEDIGDYLGTAQISLQSKYGIKYLEDFLGLGMVIVLSGVPKGTTITTAKENLQAYYVNVKEANGLGEVFDFTTDETGLIGVHTGPTYDRMQIETVIINGIEFFPERVDGIIVGTINF